MTAVLLLTAAALLLLNAFFVLAEFAAVRVRPTRVDELVNRGSQPALVVRHIQAHLDEYLSVCQVGITFASVGLGFVGEPAVAGLIQPLLGWLGPAAAAASHTIAVTIAYLGVSFLHILLGELVPKSIAIRAAERSALLTARPLQFFRLVFYVPLVVLNRSANALVRLAGLPGKAREDPHSEDEIRLILSRSQTRGVLSFRRLLVLENVLDLGGLRVRDAMHPRAKVKTLALRAPWAETFSAMKESHYTRYPVIDAGQDLPVGILHVKDAFYASPGPPELSKLVRPYLRTTEDTPLEALLGDMQRRRAPLAIVLDKAGKWTGFITLEDVVEEVVGGLEDEFVLDPPLFLADALTPGRVVLDLAASTLEDAIPRLLAAVPEAELPAQRAEIAASALERERRVGTYVGHGVAVPHARLDGLERPILVFGRAPDGIPVRDATDRAHLVFLLVTPAGSPQVHARLLVRIGGIMESDFVGARLRDAKTPAEVLETIRAGETACLG